MHKITIPMMHDADLKWIPECCFVCSVVFPAFLFIINLVVLENNRFTFQKNVSFDLSIRLNSEKPFTGLFWHYYWTSRTVFKKRLMFFKLMKHKNFSYMCSIIKYLMDKKSIIVGSNQQNVNTHPSIKFQLTMALIKSIYGYVQYFKWIEKWHYMDPKRKCLQSCW